MKSSLKVLALLISVPLFGSEQPIPSNPFKKLMDTLYKVLLNYGAILVIVDNKETAHKFIANRPLMFKDKKITIIETVNNEK